MMNKIIINLLSIVLFSCFLSGQAFAIYKHKIVVTEFDDPQGWAEPYHPGKILSDRLKQHLLDGGRFHILETPLNGKMPGSGKMMGSHAGMDNKSEMKKGFDKESGKGKSGNMNALDSMTGLESNRYKNKSGKMKKTYSSKAEDSNAGYLGLNDVEPAIRYINSDSFAEILPVQNSMMNPMGKMPGKEAMKHDPVPWPVRLGKMPEKASLFEIKGKVVRFDTGKRNTEMMGNDQTRGSEKAELELMLQLIQNKTGRVVYEQNFRAFSNSGRRAFSKDKDLGLNVERSLESSSMSIAMAFLTKEMISFVKNKLSREPLEGEIIAIKNEDVLINIGRQNGVQVGDKYHVHSLGLKFDDPLTENDLGDIYVKMGVIQVLESMLGFSRARIIIGKDLMPGNLVRSYNRFNGGNQRFSYGETALEDEEPAPWWSFHGIKSVP